MQYSTNMNNESLSENELTLISARQHVHNELALLVQKIITTFATYTLSAEELLALSKLNVLLSSPDKYKIEGYISFIVCDNKPDGDVTHRLAEILYNSNGLHLSTGGYIGGVYGGDSFTNDIYPVDAYDAQNINQITAYFLGSFMEKLESEKKTIEIDDCINISLKGV